MAEICCGEIMIQYSTESTLYITCSVCGNVKPLNKDFEK